MKDNGLGSWARRRARMTPDHAALVQDGHATTYAELRRGSTRLARGLRDRGVHRGDRVAFLGLNSVELVVAMFATAQLGAVFVPINTRLAPPELAFILGDSDAQVLLLEEALAGSSERPTLGGDARRTPSRGSRARGWPASSRTTRPTSTKRSASTTCS
jgi:fatty-acyl-CoA synthase